MQVGGLNPISNEVQTERMDSVLATMIAMLSPGKTSLSFSALWYE